MKRTIYIWTLILSGVILASCKKDLEVRNPNQPTPESASTEQGIISLAQGGVYVNGFRNLKYGDGVFGLFWSGAMGFHELMADVIQAEAANAYLNQVGVPDRVIFSNNQTILNPGSPNTQLALLRQINVNSQQGQNVTFYEWAYMYSLNNSMNSILELVETVEFTGDAASKKSTLKAWAHWWKGFAYARIGSMYYAGLIINNSFETNGNYVAKEQIIAESNRQFDLATAAINAATNAAAYIETLGKLIPNFNQRGLGLVPTPDMWKRNINTFKARNILVNKAVSAMSAADWNAVLALVNNGVRNGDNIFTGRSNATGDFLTQAGTGTVSGRVQHPQAGGNTYKLSERWVQEFRAGDQRFANNVKQTTTWIGNQDRGQAFNTRYTIVSSGLGISGVKVYSDLAIGAYELYLAGSFEENELMKAEALIYTSQVNQGLQAIDAVRNYQGAGLPPVAGSGLTQAQAIAELRSERRVALPFLGLSFYDARRWGRIFPISQGGGRISAVVVRADATVDNNATIEYNFLDYWDVPDNELVYNPPASGSAPVKNPR